MSESATIAVSKRLREIANSVDAQIKDAAGERIGFALVVFTDGRASYISNSSREACVIEINRLLDMWKHGMPDVPAHEVQ